MQVLKKFLVLVLVLGISACDITELDIQQNPNFAGPDNASIDDLFNNIQLEARNVFNGTWLAAGGMARMVAATGGFFYNQAVSPNGFNGIWGNVYNDMLPDIDALIEIADANGFDQHKGYSLILRSYCLMVLVDMFGDIPLSEATQGTDVISPNVDQGASVYAAAVADLDAAISLLSATTASAPSVDLFLGGNKDNWIAFANTLKLRAALNTGDAGMFSNVVNTANFIDNPSEDFVFQYSTNRNNPNSRHPLYNNQYEVNDGNYMSTYYMWLLRAGKLRDDGSELIDPRIRYYFYRKTDDALNQNVSTYSCFLTTTPDPDATPAHYTAVDPRMPYCMASSDGYWGRDHLNNEGIPPDGQLRTSYGLYPAGGQFDDDSFGDTRNNGTTGGLGEGFNPIMMSFFVDFMRAEAALTMNTGEDARTLLESGIRNSISKVKGFGNKVSSTLSAQVEIRGEFFSIEELYVPTDDDIDEYVNFVLAQYDAADNDGKLDIVGTEYLIALWGNGIEGYNLYRRTGKPNNMAPSLEADPGTFAYSFYYPNNVVNRNQNIDQKPDVTSRVFWNANGPSVR